jgi:hypothetical protein
MSGRRLKTSEPGSRRVLQDLFGPALIEQKPIRAGGTADFEGRQGAQNFAEEAAIAEDRLKALGYIDDLLERILGNPTLYGIGLPGYNLLAAHTGLRCGVAGPDV